MWWKCGYCGEPTNRLYNLGGIAVCPTSACKEELDKVFRRSPPPPPPPEPMPVEVVMPTPEEQHVIVVVDAENAAEVEEAIPDTQRDWEDTAHGHLAKLVEVRVCDQCHLCHHHTAEIDAHRRKE